MKKSSFLSLFLIAASAVTSFAQRPPRPPRQAPDLPPPLQGEMKELGRIADKIDAWKLANIEGADFFSKDKDELRKKYQELSSKIRQATIEDAISEDQGRKFLAELISIGKKAKKDQGTPESSIEGLDAAVQNLRKDDVKADALTPKLNELQWLMNEVAFYGIYTGEISKGRISSLKKKLDSLSSKEKSAKKNGEVSDRERENLDEKALEIWGGVVKMLHKD
ncbi:hypothetical protein N9A89_00005 [Akkermansiaceae bacterium]|nr:hypothetical protein [Akkermansiaceae bacterium]MDB4406761.1 hypothetical protein [Akkermansiaceae bacterium]